MMYVSNIWKCQWIATALLEIQLFNVWLQYGSMKNL